MPWLWRDGRRPTEFRRLCTGALVETSDDGRITPAEMDILARFNAEVARGIMHTAAWQDEMAELQRRFDQR